jgi:DNA-binding transcriptional ArsR family regulator
MLPLGVPGRLVGQSRHFVLSALADQPDWPRRGGIVSTSEEVRRTALALAERGEETDPAVGELLAACGDHRVSVVLARQGLLELQENGEDGAVGRAIELLDLVLAEGSWAE